MVLLIVSVIVYRHECAWCSYICVFNVRCYNCKSVLQEHNVIVESSFVMRLISMGFLFPLLLVTRFHHPN